MASCKGGRCVWVSKKVMLLFLWLIRSTLGSLLREVLLPRWLTWHTTYVPLPAYATLDPDKNYLMNFCNKPVCLELSSIEFSNWRASLSSDTGNSCMILLVIRFHRVVSLAHPGWPRGEEKGGCWRQVSCMLAPYTAFRICYWVWSRCKSNVSLPWFTMIDLRLCWHYVRFLANSSNIFIEIKRKT